jgi:serine/threonine protein kinase
MARVGKYELIRRLAIGGMAELHLARQSGVEGFEKTVVVKKLAPNHAKNESTVRMFLNEARIAARLSHPNVVQIYELGEEEGHYYIAMEYVHGRDLRGIQEEAASQEKPMPHGLVAHLIDCVCRALHHAHTLSTPDGRPMGLVHRDVSPQNVLLTFGGDVKLVDFGIAKATKFAAETQAGLLHGKYAHMSPEQCRGEDLDARSDVFSAGILLYELACRTRLFQRRTDFATMRALLEEPMPPPSAVSDEVPDDLESIIMHALARDRDQRYATAQEMQLDIEKAIRENGWEVGPRIGAAYMASLFGSPDQSGEMRAPSAGQAIAGDRLDLPYEEIGVIDDHDDGTDDLDLPTGPIDADADEATVVDEVSDLKEPSFDGPEAFAPTDEPGPTDATASFGGQVDQDDRPTDSVHANAVPIEIEAAETLPPERGADDTGSYLPDVATADLRPGNPPPEGAGEYDSESRAAAAAAAMLAAMDAASGLARAPSDELPTIVEPPKTPAALATVPQHSPPGNLALTPHPSGSFSLTRSPSARHIWLLLLVAAAMLVVVAVSTALLFQRRASRLEQASRPALKIVSDPPGATLHLDGEQRPGTTPLVVTDIEPERAYHLVLMIQDYAPWQTKITLHEGETRTLHARLERTVTEGRARLEVAAPAQSRIYFNGELRGRGTLAIDNVRSGVEHSLVVRQEGHIEQRITVAPLQPDTVRKITVRPSPRAQQIAPRPPKKVIRRRRRRPRSRRPRRRRRGIAVPRSRGRTFGGRQGERTPPRSK